jgi:hypothetical protein
MHPCIMLCFLLVFAQSPVNYRRPAGGPGFVLFLLSFVSRRLLELWYEAVLSENTIHRLPRMFPVAYIYMPFMNMH